MSTFPIRCFTCGKVVNSLWSEYEEKTKTREPRKVLDSMKIIRMCCRRMFLTHATAKLEEYMLKYPVCETRIEKIGFLESNSFQKARDKIIEDAEDE
jgi:DNA-directed RNA polymerase subunit N